MKWTSEMNIEVMRTFYIINRCQDEPLPGWRQSLYAEYKRRNPSVDVTEQNIADRKNVIIKKHYLKEEQLQNIKREVGQLLYQHEEFDHTIGVNQNNNIENHDNGENDLQQELNETPPFFPQETADRVVTERNRREDQQLFLNLIALYEDTNPLSRPRLPKLRNISKSQEIISSINTILLQYLGDANDLKKVHLGLYCAAALTLQLNGQQVYQPNPNRKSKHGNTPMWKKRLQKSVDEYRGQADLLGQFLSGNNSKRVITKVNNICRKAHIDSSAPDYHARVLELKDLLRQKAKAKGARLHRYNKLTKRKTQNKEFECNQKKFLQGLENSNEGQNINIDPNRFTTYWQGIWGDANSYNENAAWLEEITRHSEPINEMLMNDIAKEDITSAIKRTQNWKAPGPDGIHNFWLKHFTASHECLARCFTKALNDPHAFPDFLMTGNTYMLFKKADPADPKNYRPITCLSTIYKLFTSLINNKIYEHCELNNIFEEEQKGCIRKTAGCKHQLTIDAIVLKQAQLKKRNLHMCYIDYSKAFDSVPHDWLMKVLEIYKISPKIRILLRHLMQAWKTNIYVSNENAGQVHIRKGIFQGDSLSPVWFCLALNPLSTLLNSTGEGYKINMRHQRKLTHLLYMDDLKLYSANTVKLQNLIETTRRFSDDIRMSFGLDKCATVNVMKGKLHNNPEVYADIQQLPLEQRYKYLGIGQSSSIDHAQLKREFQEKYRSRVTKLLNTLLSGGNLIKAINSWAIPSLTYSFGIVKWSVTDLEALDRLTRRLMTKFRQLHTNSSVDRLYLPRNRGGRGLINIKNLCLRQETDLRRKLLRDEGSLISMAAREDKGYTPLTLGTELIQAEISTHHQTEDSWKSHALHGRFPKMLQQTHVDQDNSIKWLKEGSIYAETEGFLIAIQDRVIKTRNYQKYCLKNDIEDKCRICGSIGETIEHIMGGCPALSDTAYLGRHNQLAKIVHQQLAIKHGLLQTAPPYYKYVPQSVLETPRKVLYWDRPIITDRTMDFNRPDIVLIDKEQKTGTIIDIAVPLTHNIQKTEREKIAKYVNLAYELKRLWKLEKVTIHPLVISAEGLMTPKFSETIKELGLPNNIIRSGQKAVLLQTCHIVRRVMGQDEIPPHVRA